MFLLLSNVSQLMTKKTTFFYWLEKQLQNRKLKREKYIKKDKRDARNIICYNLSQKDNHTRNICVCYSQAKLSYKLNQTEKKKKNPHFRMQPPHEYRITDLFFLFDAYKRLYVLHLDRNWNDSNRWCVQGNKKKMNTFSSKQISINQLNMKLVHNENCLVIVSNNNLIWINSEKKK